MNPRQRRGVLLMVMAGLAAVVVFVALASYVGQVNSQVGAKMTVWKASKDVPAFSQLTSADLEQVSVPEKWAPSTSVTNSEQLDGRKVGFNVKAGTFITQDMLVPPSDLSPTEREIAIDVNAVTGVAGRVQPGDFVDIYAVFADVPGLAKQVRVLVRNVRVISVGGRQTVQADPSQDEDGKASDVIPVSLALEPNDALAVTYAGAFAEEVRLVKLPTGNTQNRSGESDKYDAERLGGKAVAEEGK
ncbi:Flp pilus assembly protein CpaB [Angustibacter luteus]|uniref:Flp pilus assembly protein CpaB n=1 Tax=Angustibacter luteus TaxID=658456 RepID=A0ABW1J9E7_9ACTN